MEHLDAFIPGCEYTICGGWVASPFHWSEAVAENLDRYRRGKPASNDVDVVFCPPKDGQDIGLLKDLYLRLSQLGIVTHVLRAYRQSCSSCPN